MKIVIAVGHSGFDVDKKIAENVDGIDLVIGGHSNTFLYNGKPPSNEKSDGNYPHIVKRGQQEVPVVSAFKYSKYLGKLDVSIQDGKITPQTRWKDNNPTTTYYEKKGNKRIHCYILSYFSCISSLNFIYVPFVTFIKIQISRS